MYLNQCREAPVKGPRFLRIAIFFWFIVPGLSGAQAATDTVLVRLAHSSGWLGLLHYSPGLERSNIVDKDFFLASDGDTNPLHELNALVDAFSQPPGAIPNTHPRCRFPARYYWLSKQLAAPAYRRIPAFCGKLRQWNALQETQSVSLIFVSGYLGNPASIFGHAFLKLNTGEKDELFDQSVSYGTLIPPHEPTLTYIIKGLSGGYLAGFSDHYFYNQDISYSRTEFRDMWSYDLNLSSDERRYLLLHLWEIVGKKKTYYFLNRNCVYELGRLLEIVIDNPLVRHARAWYAPVELFNQIQDANTGTGPLVSRTRYIPSAERMLIDRYRRLDRKQRALALKLLDAPAGNMQLTAIRAEPVASQSAILNFALAAQQFRYIKEQPDPSRDTLARRRWIILQRLKLPAGDQNAPNPPDLPAPSTASPPMRLGLGAGRAVGGNSFPVLSLSPFAREASAHNHLQGNELVLLDTLIALDASIAIEQIDYFRVQKLTTGHVPMPELEAWSWKTSGSTIRTRTSDKTRYNHKLSFSGGKSFGNRKASLTLFAGISANSMSPTITATPEAELYVEMSHRTKLVAGARRYRLPTGRHPTTQYNLEIQHAFNRRYALLLRYRENRETRWIAELRVHW